MYVKLFSSLYQGTLRGRSDEILVFTNLLAHADQHGVVDKHWRAIAEETGLSKERVEEAIKNLEEPDPESRSPEMNGCRIVRLDEHRLWGWQVVNYGKYRAIRNEDDRREQNRIAQEKWRSKQNKPRKPKKAHTEAEAYTEADTLKDMFCLPSWIDVKAWTEWEKFRIERKKPLSDLSRKKCVAVLEKHTDKQKEIIDMSIMNGWTGLFPPNGKQSKGKSAVDLVEEAYRSEG